MNYALFSAVIIEFILSHEKCAQKEYHKPNCNLVFRQGIEIVYFG